MHTAWPAGDRGQNLFVSEIPARTYGFRFPVLKIKFPDRIHQYSRVNPRKLFLPQRQQFIRVKHGNSRWNQYIRKSTFACSIGTRHHIQVSQEMILENYLQVKRDIDLLIENEIQRIMNTPELEHLLIEKE